MIFISFSVHIDEKNHKQAIEELSGQKIEVFIQHEVQFDAGQPFVSQVEAVMEAIGFDELAERNLPILVYLPSLNYIAALVLAEIHGRTGSFPSILRVKPVDREGVRTFELAEVINLNEVRDKARTQRTIT